MPSFLTKFVLLIGALTCHQTLAVPIPPTPGDMTSITAILEHDIESAYTRFELSSSYPDILSSPLVLELQVNPVDSIYTSDVTLNEVPLTFNWEHVASPDDLVLASADTTTRSLSLTDNFGFDHTVDVSLSGSILSEIIDDIEGSTTDALQRLSIQITSIDGEDLTDRGLLGFVAVTRPLAANRLQSLSTINQPYLDLLTIFYMTGAPDADSPPYVDDVHIDDEIASLLFLEEQAGLLREQIATKKQNIAKLLRNNRDHVSLRYLLQQCDGILCAARVIAQRICDKVGLDTQPSLDYMRMQNPQVQYVASAQGLDEKPQQASRNYTKLHGSGKIKLDGADPAILSMSKYSNVEWNNPTSALLRVLEIIAGILGLASLFALIRRKCASPRTKAERLADREERRNARAYRRAARRAFMRQRWDAFIKTFCCFTAQDEPLRNDNYDEKRALILQDAFLEQELEHAEKGDVMEAEIRELRYAHEIVSSLVRVDERHYPMTIPIRDPPPCLVPLPYNAHSSRSRASTATLPSYTSESLPDYTSRLATEPASSIAGGSESIRSATSTTADSGRARSITNSSVDMASENGRQTRSTPTSSVAYVSPRPSEETLRTRLSKESRRF